MIEAHIGPWTEQDLVALPEGLQRYELVEGRLLVSPSPAVPHQMISLNLAAVLKASLPKGLVVVEAVGVRLANHTVFIPDVVVAERAAALANRSGTLDASVVRLVVEIVSPGSGTMDRLTKPALLAQAGVPSYWRAEPEEGPDVHAFSLEGDHYVEVASARPGELLVVSFPAPLSLDPAELRP